MRSGYFHAKRQLDLASYKVEINKVNLLLKEIISSLYMSQSFANLPEKKKSFA